MIATYRVQMGGDVDFAFVRGLVPYLRELGVSHLYLSPVWQAREGSTHGYDVIDPARVSDALGGEEGLRDLAAQGLGLVLDVVPNHMATDDANRFWTEERERFFDVDPETGRWRRFFDIDELAAVRQEDPEVFAATHAKVLELARDGVVAGLRIDHPDGLADPAGYLARLREGGAEHVWVEKILDPGERLRGDWACDGTVGYEFANDVTALFCDPAAEPVFDELWRSLTGDERPFGEIAAAAKLEQAATTFQPEVQRLRRIHDLPDLEVALSALPVYRTYVEPATGKVADEDREAAAHLPEAARRAVLLEDDVPHEFVVRFQQTTPPVMAKGVEDTAFYRYLRLVALNEVGGDPSRWSIPVERFHEGNLIRPPRNLLVSTTHDTKRSGDVRARLCALTAMPRWWADSVRSWFEVNAELRRGAAPTPAEELLIYQTLVGAWPVSAERLEEYLVKALREAKTSSSWIEPDTEHEQAVVAFAVALMDHGPFRYGFDALAARVSDLGERIALAQTLLRLTVPGVPDVYQGDELWTYSLVDPDNRRPVDWEARRQALDAARAGGEPTRETAKLHLIQRTLALRARRPEAFAGDYVPVPAGEEVCCFMRGGDVLVAVALHDRSTGAGGWRLPDTATGTWRDVLSGAEVELPEGATLAGILGPEGRALLERAG